MIPKKIWTVWLSTGPTPEVIQKCIDSQQIPGYEHQVITLTNIDTDIFQSRYMQEALNSPHRDGIKYCKMSDYLRMRYLYKYGGIYLDADCWMLEGKNFDDMLKNGIFAAKENNGFVGSAVVGAEQGHPFLAEWIRRVEEGFRGDDDLNFQSSMEILTQLYYSGFSPEFQCYPTTTLYPYDHQLGTIEVTPDTRVFHDFTKTWTDSAKDVLPRVSIVIPTLGREDGLRKCLASIDRLYYPKHLIETIVLDGPGTVPEKVAKGLEASTGDYIAYMANDTEIDPSALYEAVRASQTHKKGLVAFHEGPVAPDLGNVCTHFIIHRDLIQRIGGEIFDTRYYHVGVDNLLWAKCYKLGEALHCGTAIIKHHHFSTGDSPYDEVYARGWNTERVKHDRDLLAKDLEELNGRPS